ncbi:MAG: CHAT domain-containing protein, partial [Deltaproteobacteria bacterium]
MVAVLLAAISTFTCGRANADSLKDRLSALQDSVSVLRQHDRIGEARDLALEILRLARADSAAFHYVLFDTKLLISTLDFIATLPDSSRQRLAEAERLEARTWHFLDDEWSPRRASEAARKAREIRRRILGEDHIDTVRITHLAAVVTRYIRRCPECGADMRQALRRARTILGPEHPLIGRMLLNLASFSKAEGKFAEAEPLFQEALAMLRRTEGPMSDNISECLNNYGFMLRVHGDYARALPLFRKAYEMNRALHGEAHPWTQINARNLAVCLNDLGRRDEALAILKRSLELAEAQPTEKADLAGRLDRLTKLYFLLGDYDRAEATCRRALRVRDYWHNRVHSGGMVSINTLGRILEAKGNYAGADSCYRLALDDLRNQPGTDPTLEAAYLTERAGVLYEEGRLREAESVLEEAAHAFDVGRWRAAVDWFERASLSAENTPYRLLALVRVRLGQPVAAWTAIEKARARVIVDRVRTRETRRISPEEREQESRLERELSRLEDALAQALSAASGDGAGSTRADSIRTALADARAAWSRFELELSRRHPISEGHPLSLREVQTALDSHEAIVGWLDVSDEAYAYVVRARGPVQWVPLTATGTDSLPQAFRRALASAPASADSFRARALGRRLYAARLLPIEPQLRGIERLHVVASGPMTGVPVEALVTPNDRYAADRWEISYAPSATILTWLRERPAPQSP